MTSSSLLRSSCFALLGIGIAVAQRPPRTSPAAQAKPHAATPYVITGTVVSSVSQSPVPHCRMTVAPVVRGSFSNRQFPAELDPVDCDEHGHFSVSLPSAGSWRLTASARGFVTQSYDEYQSYFSAIVLTAAKPTMDLQFHISPECVITGIVVDEAGEPVRKAQVSLQTVPEPIPGGGARPPGRIGSNTQTDDRGMYELVSLAPGAYRITVQAQPWYAAYQPRAQSSSTAAPLDPSLDFTYPVTWFPGVDDPSLAETITLHAGDVRQADLHLTPVPSIHLRIQSPPSPGNAPNGRAAASFPNVQQIIPGGAGQPVAAVSMQTDPQGQVDIGGLAPGTYRVGMSGQGRDSASSIVELTAGSTRTLDLASASTAARVTLSFEGLPDSDSPRRVEVNLVDTDTGLGSFSFNEFSSNGGPGNFSRRGRRDRPRDSGSDRRTEVPPGRYEVVLQGSPDVYLTGLTAKGAEVAGRYVTVAAGTSTLTLHLASGRATLTGVATFQDKPTVAALVLLVPTTIDDPNSLRILRREQTNTDGSFDLGDVIPGQYILVVIDHGREINWSDPSTLRGYLTQGVAVDLASGADVKQNINAQAP
jgi:Carboxypeptidase regulatory-like domain